MRDSELERLQVEQQTIAAKLDALRERHAARVTTMHKGERGQTGPIGPMPEHRWAGTSLQFQQGPDGEEWGPLVELKGDKGEDGVTRVVSGGGGGGPIVINGFFPQGW